MFVGVITKHSADITCDINAS